MEKFGSYWSGFVYRRVHVLFVRYFWILFWNENLLWFLTENQNIIPEGHEQVLCTYLNLSVCRYLMSALRVLSIFENIASLFKICMWLNIFWWSSNKFVKWPYDRTGGSIFFKSKQNSNFSCIGRNWIKTEFIGYYISFKEKTFKKNIFWF